MSLVGVVLISGMVVLLTIGVPIAFSLGLTSFLAIMASERIPTLVFAQRMFTACDSFPLMAILFFIIAGELMCQGGISRRLVNFASSILGGIRGSLALISVVTCAFFGAISGSALATTAAIGGIMYPEMVKRGYKEDFAATLQAASGTLGILIPPSIPLVIYGVLTGVSIGDLFIAIVGGGLITTALYCLTAYIIIVREGMVPAGSQEARVPIGKSFREAVWGLLTPVIILGGIYGGIFTPTESAIVGSVYALLVGTFIYKELNWGNFSRAMGNSAVAAASVMIIIATATLFGWIMTSQNIPVMVASAVIEFTNNKYTFLLLANIIYLIAGMFMETSTIILLMVPLLLPVALKLGIDPLHFGIITNINLALGLITPPFGASLFVIGGISQLPIDRIYRRTFWFVVAGIIGILVITYVPAFSIGYLRFLKG
jgi:C4-dicarboxylate transporter, DctM subunit